MREILFRGKRADSGEWVEGDLIQVGLHDKPKYASIMPQTPVSCVYGVLADTVGQFTGLTDKNGVNLIFEGDICRFKYLNDVHVGEIVFYAATASFVMKYQSIVGVYGEKATHKMLLSACDNIEVIGNIHDNPELME